MGDVLVMNRPDRTSRTLGYSDTFDGPTGLRHAWDAVRGDALVAAGQPRNARDCRLAPGSIVLDMLHSGRWLPYCSLRVDMEDRLKANRRLDKCDRTKFRLRLANLPADPAACEADLHVAPVPAGTCRVSPELRSQWRNGDHWHAVWPEGGHWCFPTEEDAAERVAEVQRLRSHAGE